MKWEQLLQGSRKVRGPGAGGQPPGWEPSASRAWTLLLSVPVTFKHTAIQSDAQGKIQKTTLATLLSSAPTTHPSSFFHVAPYMYLKSVTFCPHLRTPLTPSIRSHPDDSHAHQVRSPLCFLSELCNNKTALVKVIKVSHYFQD